MDIRRPHLKRYQRQLRDALLNPALTGEQRIEIKDQLLALGQPRQYGSPGQMQSAPKPTPTPVVVPAQTIPSEPDEDLLVLTKDELLALAVVEEVGPFKSKATKNEIARAILDKRKTA
jgi:hypothetical protein